MHNDDINDRTIDVVHTFITIQINSLESGQQEEEVYRQAVLAVSELEPKELLQAFVYFSGMYASLFAFYCSVDGNFIGLSDLWKDYITHYYRGRDV